MDSRADIERILDRAYAARQKQDIEAVLECFCSEGQFCANGSDAVAADAAANRRATLEGIFDTFQLLDFKSHCRVIDPPHAVVHWRGKFQAKKNGQVADTDVLDIFMIKDGRIVSLTTFYDTALAARLTGAMPMAPLVLPAAVPTSYA